MWASTPPFFPSPPPTNGDEWSRKCQSKAVFVFTLVDKLDMILSITLRHMSKGWQAQDGVNMGFKVEFDLEGQSTPKNNRDLNQGVLHFLSAFVGSSLNRWSYRQTGVDTWHTHEHTYTQTDRQPGGQTDGQTDRHRHTGRRRQTDRQLQYPRAKAGPR